MISVTRKPVGRFPTPGATASPSIRPFGSMRPSRRVPRTAPGIRPQSGGITLLRSGAKRRRSGYLAQRQRELAPAARTLSGSRGSCTRCGRHGPSAPRASVARISSSHSARCSGRGLIGRAPARGPDGGAPPAQPGPLRPPWSSTDASTAGPTGRTDASAAPSYGTGRDGPGRAGRDERVVGAIPVRLQCHQAVGRSTRFTPRGVVCGGRPAGGPRWVCQGGRWTGERC